MEWENIPDNIEDWFGFVYVIERLNAKPEEPRYYWGCKQFWKSVKLKPLKGKKRSRRKQKESDWKTYYGSSPKLNEDVKTFGEDNFKRTILKLCTCKWQLKYEELKMQLENDVLLRTDCYNGIVNVRIGKVPKDLILEYNKK